MKPALDWSIQVSRGESVGELLEALRVSTLDNGVGCLTEGDPFVLELACQMFVLVHAHPRVEWEVRADARNIRPQS